VPADRRRDGLSLAFVHEGLGGYPLPVVLLYPETPRIWVGAIGPLAAAGDDYAPDLGGYGYSDVSKE